MPKQNIEKHIANESPTQPILVAGSDNLEIKSLSPDSLKNREKAAGVLEEKAVETGNNSEMGDKTLDYADKYKDQPYAQAIIEKANKKLRVLT